MTVNILISKPAIKAVQNEHYALTYFHFASIILSFIYELPIHDSDIFSNKVASFRANDGSFLKRPVNGFSFCDDQFKTYVINKLLSLNGHVYTYTLHYTYTAYGSNVPIRS